MSQQIGAQLQGPPMPYMQGLQDPTPGIARNVAAAGASLIPLGAGAAHGVAAHFMPRLFNPMNAGMAGFQAAGVQGMGTMGAVGMGLGAAAVPMAGMLAANWAGAQVFQGARQSAGFRQQAQANMSFVNTGSMTGRGAATGQVTEMAKTMRDVATETMSSFDEMQKIFQSMSDMGMMQTVRDAKDFERKFKTLTKSAKEVSRIMGTTMEEASGVIGSMRLSGMYSPDEVIGQTVQRGVLASHGMTGQQITQQQAQGASMAHSMGALRGTGARLTTRVTGDVARAAAMGTISSEQLIEATGMEGPEAYAAFGQKMTATAMDFTKTGVGRAMMAIAGEKDGESYTGKIDMGKLASLQHMDTGKLGAMAQAAMGTSDEARQSFHSQKERLAGVFAEKAGPEQMAGFVKKLVQDRYGHVGQDDMAVNIMKMFGNLDRTEAEMLASLASQSGEIAADRKREEQQELQRVAMNQQRMFSRSIGGVKKQLHRAVQRVGDPLFGVGADIEGALSATGEDFSDMVYGRSRQMGVSRRGMEDIMHAGGSSDLSLLDGHRVSGRGFTEAARQDLYRASSGKLGKMEIGKDISARQFADISASQRREITGTMTVDEFGMGGTTQDEMKALGRQLGAYIGGVNLTGDRATEDIIGNALADKTLAPELRAALEKTLRAGTSQGGAHLEGRGAIKSFRGSKGYADADRFVKQALSDVNVDVGGQARLDATAVEMQDSIESQQKHLLQQGFWKNVGDAAGGLSANVQNLAIGALDLTWVGGIAKTGLTGKQTRRQIRGMDSLPLQEISGKSRRQIRRTFEESPERRDQMISMLKGKNPAELAKLADQAKAGANLDDPELNAMFGDLTEADRRAMAELAEEMSTGGHDLGGISAALGEFEGAVGTQGRERLLERISVSGARFTRGLEGKETDTRFGDYSKGADALKIARDWGKKRKGREGDFGTSKAVELEKLLRGTSSREQILGELGAVEGGQTLLHQVDLISRGRKNLGRGGMTGATTMEEVEKFMGGEGLTEMGGALRADVEKALKDGKVDASESEELMRSLSQRAGAAEESSAAGAGGKVTRTMSGETMDVARALSDLGAQQSRFNTETADALEKVGRVTRGMESQLQKLAP